ncbi:hypothetical protein QFC24_004265 [Naganishia onofrii]|uniref:Uncharacterized protein n=1 Tax=Naganishia onofrii TaxID=1851511 RepID=A0ACC2XDX7_9TREE|nr:hypothetical protein QFC24_004265 [Naganishia onofrii]
MSSAPSVQPQTATSAGKRRVKHGHGHHPRGGALSSNSSRDASDEDNTEEQTDDAASTIYPSSPFIPLGDNATGTGAVASPHGSESAHKNPAIAAEGANPPAHQRIVQLGTAGRYTAAGQGDVGDSDSEAVDSPTYDGDVESTSVHGALAHAQEEADAQQQSLQGRGQSDTPKGNASNDFYTPHIPSVAATGSVMPEDDVHPIPRDVISHPLPPSQYTRDAAASAGTQLVDGQLISHSGPPKMIEPPALLPEADIRAFVRRAIEGKGQVDGVVRNWKTSEPPTDRPVRVYADGVYDLFHFGHALQLRQAKLSFPNVHLIVGVCSDDLCAEHKSAPAMTHAERCEGVKHCRWADEVAPDAPWQIDQEWIDRYRIDYVAHDEMVYPTKGVVDVYDFVKKQGRFLPTRRTPCISTSDLLERIVRGYRDGFFDSKLEKNGHPELMASDVDWDSSASVERREIRRRRTAAGGGGAARVGHAHKEQEGGVKGLVKGMKDLVAGS